MVSEQMRPPVFMIPPPEALIAKTVVTKEEAKGATSFVQIARLMGKERVERLNAYHAKRMREPVDPTGVMSDYMVQNWQRNRLIYCRYGEKHLEAMEKRKSSNLASANQPMQNLGTASYLLNIKKMIEEHNLDSEKRDFKKMTTTKQFGGAKGKDQPETVNTHLYKPQGPNDLTLNFESRFESGNLLAEIKVS